MSITLQKQTKENTYENEKFEVTEEELNKMPVEIQRLDTYNLNQKLNLMKTMNFKFHLHDKDTDELIAIFESPFKTSLVLEKINDISISKFNREFNVDHTTLLLHLKTIMRLPCYRRRYTIKKYYLRVEGFPEPIKSDSAKQVKKNFSSPFHIQLKNLNFKLFNAVTNEFIGEISGHNFKTLFDEFLDKTHDEYKNVVKFNKIIKDLIASKNDFEIINNIKLVKCNSNTAAP